MVNQSENQLSFASSVAFSQDPEEVVDLFRCNGCDVSSPRVRVYSLTTVFVSIVGCEVRVDHLQLCPTCMRWHILTRLPIAILISNLVSPVVVVIWFAVYFKTFFHRAPVNR